MKRTIQQIYLLIEYFITYQAGAGISLMLLFTGMFLVYPGIITFILMLITLELGLSAIVSYFVEKLLFVRVGILKMRKNSGRLHIIPVMIKGKTKDETIKLFKDSIMGVKRVAEEKRIKEVSTNTHRAVLRIFLEVFGEMTPDDAKDIIDNLERGEDAYQLTTPKTAIHIDFLKMRIDPSFAILGKDMYKPRRFYKLKIIQTGKASNDIPLPDNKISIA